MIFQSPGDVFFKIFDFPVYYYGVVMAAACYIGIYASYRVFKKYNPESNFEAIWDFSVWVLLSGILGARLYYCLLNLDYYIYHPLQILNIRQGGLSIHGALIFGILALIIAGKKAKLPPLNLLDSFVCGLSLAQSVGRWGNFFNSEAYGYPTNVFWKLYIPPQHRYTEFMNYSYYHPAFLYESILDLCLFFVLLYLMHKFAKNMPGAVFAIYIILYSVIRIFVESIRIDSALDIFGMPFAKVMSVLLIIMGIVFWAAFVRRKNV